MITEEERRLRRLIRSLIEEQQHSQVETSDEFKSALDDFLVYMSGVKDPLETALNAAPERPEFRTAIVGIYNDIFQQNDRLRKVIEKMKAGKAPSRDDF